MNEIVRDWMNRGCPYWEGVAIYEQMGSNEAVKKLLKMGSTAFFKDKLKAAMMEMLGKGEAVVNTRVEEKIKVKGERGKVEGEGGTDGTGGTKNKPAKKTGNIDLKSYRKGDIYLLPEDVGLLVKLKGQTYNGAATLHATLLKGKNPEKRKAAAFEILRLMAITQNCWSKLNYYDKYGALPVDVDAVNYETLSSGERELLIQRHRVYLSRHKWLGEPDAIEHPKYLYFSKEYLRRKKELEELEKVA